MAGQENEVAVELPSIIQDATETFLHNVAVAINAGLSDDDKPKKVLIVGTKNKRDLNLPHTMDPYYSHELIKKVDEDPDYIPEEFPINYIYTYGDTTVYYLLEEGIDESQGVVNCQPIQMSYLLGTKRGDEI